MTKKLENFSVEKGETYSAESALTIRFNITQNGALVDRESFGNVRDSNIPHAKEWRDSKDVKIDFSDVTLETTPEDIEKKKQAFLEKYPVSSEGEMLDSYKAFSDARKKSSKEIGVGWIYDVVMNGLYASEDYGKTLEYANKLIDNLIDQQKVRLGEKNSCEPMDNIESPFVTRWDKILGRIKIKDPFLTTLKECAYRNCDMGENARDFIQELQEVKTLFPKTQKEMDAIDFSERKEIFDTHFKEKHTAYQEEAAAKGELLGRVVQISIRDNVSQAFDEQLKSHITTLEEKRRKEEVEQKKNEILERIDRRLEEMKTAPLSGVVVADKIAEDIIKDRVRHKEKVESGILSKEDKAPTLSYKETNALAETIQGNIAKDKQEDIAKKVEIVEKMKEKRGNAL